MAEMCGSFGSMMGGGPTWAWAWPAAWLIGIALLGALGYVLLRGWRGDDGRASARQILDERYARGQISDEEYRQRAEVLR
jgi:putative membrane protein